VSTLKDLSPDK